MGVSENALIAGCLALHLLQLIAPALHSPTVLKE